nr:MULTISPECIES: HAD-IA family hydrolase [unclassified Luteimonas]
MLDFDGVLARYDHRRRLAYLATHAGCEPARVDAALFASGLEAEYDSGRVDTGGYLERLGGALACRVDHEAWAAARLAGTVADAQALACLDAVDASVALGVLTNNGALMQDLIPRIVAPLSARLVDTVLVSGTLGMRKPDPRVFERALGLLGWDARSTLFIDDTFANVQGARKAGLHADTAGDARALRRVLVRYRLA